MATKKKAPASATAKYQLPIDQVMTAVDLRKGDYYNKLGPDELKSLSTYMAQRWGSQVQGTQDLQEYYLTTVNDLSNLDYIAVGSAHDELRWRTLALCGIGHKMRHEFIPPKGAKKDKLTAWLIEQFPSMDDEEIELFRTLNGNDVLEDIAVAKNMGNKDLKDLFK
jgi:hypothetical protein